MKRVRMKRSVRATTRNIARQMRRPRPCIKDGRCRRAGEFLISVIRSCLPCRPIGGSRLGQESPWSRLALAPPCSKARHAAPPSSVGLMFPSTFFVRSAAALLVTLSLAGCLATEENAASLRRGRPGVERDPTLLIATTRLPVGDPIQKPWFSGQRAQGLIYTKAQLSRPDRSLTVRVTLSTH